MFALQVNSVTGQDTSARIQGFLPNRSSFPSRREIHLGGCSECHGNSGRMRLRRLEPVDRRDGAVCALSAPQASDFSVDQRLDLGTERRLVRVGSCRERRLDGLHLRADAE